MPPALLSLYIAPNTPADREKLARALQVLAAEDPDVRMSGGVAPDCAVIGTTSEAHLERVVDRLKREFEVEARVGRPTVAYLETLTRSAEGSAKHVSTAHGQGEYAHVSLRLHPAGTGTGYSFEDATIGGSIPKRFMPSIDSGIRESMAHQCAVDPEAEPGVELSLDTTVAEWRAACDLLGTKRLAKALNEDWELTIPAAQWSAVLEPPKSRKLRGVCELIASQARRSEVSSVVHFGTSSKAAGAFLAVRSVLVKAGADAATIRPSLPIAGVAKRFPSAFLGPISKLAPAELPTVAIRTPALDAASAVAGVGLLGLLALLVAGWLGFTRWRAELTTLFAVASGTGLLGAWVAGRFVEPAEVRFGEIVTFRDLAETIAGERTFPRDAGER